MEFVTDEVSRIERTLAPGANRTTVLQALRVLGLDDFGQLMFEMPDARYPRISEILPAMASEQVQKDWTGASGGHLLMQTLDFVRSVVYNYTKFSGRSLDGKSVLDFGCGYGRIARLMYYFVDPACLNCVDPWDESIRICADDGLTENFFVSDYLPKDLPTGDTRFDLIYAFSVFTHLSERATRTAIDTLLAKLKPEGMLTITIRPLEYWHTDRHAAQIDGKAQELIERHRREGFAFLPHDRAKVDGDITYGDTSLSLDWIRQSFPAAKLLGIDRSLSDPYQIYVFLGPV